ncbi:tagatose-6-phosphate ketose/aldose isomerase [Streptococcus gallinaceus]|uniref:SIS domain-containing protein n=1 Tax=Streptococcus gallinaceus TaxID=165758 RepID=UPI0020A18AE0|nr:SIS domain-containing protein [Streptococcus gallinaceus]MCP1639003.1 tagatose-6-phosphate ketose/aldose isomerase [Streptococcus gallinaceus]MCP1769753.1 tagatose-6-phosphate ketose/aldose isomerase [Streptococcus gallinaceus]
MLFKSTEDLMDLGAEITTREIRQQPEIWKEALTIFKENREDIATFLEKVTASSADKPVKVIFTGAGTSQYVGDTLVPYLKRTGNRQRFVFESAGSTDLVSAPYDYLFEEETVLLVSFARSGNSPESVAAVALTNQIVPNAYHLTITCAPEGLLARQAQEDGKNLLLLMPPRSNDAGFAMTGSFTCMFLTGLLIFDERETIETKENYVSYLSKMGQDILGREEEIQALVDLDFNRVVYLGSGAMAALTREAQLKILELTAGKIATMFDSSMGFRHGPKSFVDAKTIVIDFVHNDSYTRQYDLDLLEEVAGDGIALKTVAIAQKGEVSFSGYTFELLSDMTLPEGYLALAAILVAQIFALFTSIKIENTPDTPSETGTVNRVVKGVIIHEYDSN